MGTRGDETNKLRKDLLLTKEKVDDLTKLKDAL